MQSITNTHISCKYIYLHIHFLEYNNLAHSDKGHRSICIVFTHTETPSHWKHTALYSMTLLQFSTFPVPIHIPRCWTKSILKTSASYQTYNSHTISQNRFRRNFKWKNHFYTQPSYVCGYNLARNNCYNLKGRKVRFWCLQFSQVFKWEPPLFPVPDTVGLRLRLAPSPSLCLHWKPKPSYPAWWCKNYFSQHSDLKHPTTFSTSQLSVHTNTTSLLNSSHRLRRQCSPHCLNKLPAVSWHSYGITSHVWTVINFISISFKCIPQSTILTATETKYPHSVSSLSRSTKMAGAVTVGFVVTAVSGTVLTNMNEHSINSTRERLCECWLRIDNRKCWSWTQISASTVHAAPDFEREGYRLLLSFILCLWFPLPPWQVDKFKRFLLLSLLLWPRGNAAKEWDIHGTRTSASPVTFTTRFVWGNFSFQKQSDS